MDPKSAGHNPPGAGGNPLATTMNRTSYAYTGNSGYAYGASPQNLDSVTQSASNLGHTYSSQYAPQRPSYSASPATNPSSSHTYTGGTGYTYGMSPPYSNYGSSSTLNRGYANPSPYTHAAPSYSVSSAPSRSGYGYPSSTDYTCGTPAQNSHYGASSMPNRDYTNPSPYAHGVPPYSSSSTTIPSTSYGYTGNTECMNRAPPQITYAAPFVPNPSYGHRSQYGPAAPQPPYSQHATAYNNPRASSYTNETPFYQGSYNHNSAAYIKPEQKDNGSVPYTKPVRKDDPSAPYIKPEQKDDHSAPYLKPEPRDDPSALYIKSEPQDDDSTIEPNAQPQYGRSGTKTQWKGPKHHGKKPAFHEHNARRVGGPGTSFRQTSSKKFDKSKYTK